MYSAFVMHLKIHGHPEKPVQCRDRLLLPDPENRKLISGRIGGDGVFHQVIGFPAAQDPFIEEPVVRLPRSLIDTTHKVVGLGVTESILLQI